MIEINLFYLIKEMNISKYALVEFVKTIKKPSTKQPYLTKENLFEKYFPIFLFKMILNKSYVFPVQIFNAAIETSGNSTNVPIRFIIAKANIKMFSRYNKCLFFKNIQIKTELAVNEIKKKFTK
jgi:hypothetical protein